MKAIPSNLEIYNFPKPGGAEYERLDTQHKIWMLSLNGLYPQEVKDKVERLMAESSSPAILDVGCGSAIWGIQMANLFHQASVLGIDMAALGARPIPSNFRFETHNLSSGLPYTFQAKFDIIHCRTVLQHVPDPLKLMESMTQALKPGGLLLIGDIDMAVYDENREHLKFPVYHTAWTMEENLEKQKGLSWNSAWADGLASISYSPTYAPPSALVKKFPKLTLLVDQDLWSAYGEWPENKDRKRKEIKELWKANFEHLYEATRGIYAKTLSQIPERFRETMFERGLKEAVTEKRYMKLLYVVAIRA